MNNYLLDRKGGGGFLGIVITWMRSWPLGSFRNDVIRLIFLIYRARQCSSVKSLEIILAKNYHICRSKQSSKASLNLCFGVCQDVVHHV